MLTNIVRMFSPMQILRLRLVQTNTRLRAAVFEVLPRLWKRHQVRLDKTRLNLQNIDAEYMASNAILFSRMEQWVIQIELTDEHEIKTVMQNLDLKNKKKKIAKHIIYYLKCCQMLGINQKKNLADALNLPETQSMSEKQKHKGAFRKIGDKAHLTQNIDPN